MNRRSFFWACSASEASSDGGSALPQRLFFTDGAAIWAELNTEDGDKVFAELVGKRANQYVWRPVIESFAREIRFDDNGDAVAWQLSKRIEICQRRSKTARLWLVENCALVLR